MDSLQLKVYITMFFYNPDENFYSAILNIWNQVEENNFQESCGNLFIQLRNQDDIALRFQLKHAYIPYENEILNNSSLIEVIDDMIKLTSFLSERNYFMNLSEYVFTEFQEGFDEEGKKFIFHYHLSSFELFNFSLILCQPNEQFYCVDYKNIHLKIDNFLSQHEKKSILFHLKKKSTFRFLFLHN